MDTKRTLPYAATLHRRWGDDDKVIWTRRFARLETCVRRMSELAILSGFPGDVIEVVNTISWQPVGVLTISVHGIRFDYSPEQERVNAAIRAAINLP